MIRNILIIVLGVSLLWACSAKLNAEKIDTGVEIQNPINDCPTCDVKGGDNIETV